MFKHHIDTAFFRDTPYFLGKIVRAVIDDFVSTKLGRLCHFFL